MSYASTVLADSPVGYWKFNEGSGTTITDYGSAAKNLTTSGTPTMSNSGPISGETCMTCVSSSSQYASVADAGHVFQSGDTFSFEVWYKRSATQGTFQDIISHGTSSGEIQLKVASDNTVILQAFAQGTIVHIAALTDTASWHHIVVTKSGSTRKMYLDGVDATILDTDHTIASSSNPFNVGRRADRNEFLNGSLAHLAVYSTALTSGQVSAHYAAATVAAPTNSVAPVASGTATVGQTLSTTDGTWTGSPTFTYQWQRDTAGNLSFSNIGSATSNTYVLVDADDGNKIQCVVTGTNAGGTATGNSNALGLVIEPVPTNSVAPAVTGSTTVGSTLTCTTGTWTHQGGTVATYAYQWQRDAAGNLSYSNISSATASTYVLVAADDACNVRCVVTATNSGGAGTPANSNATLDTTPVPSSTASPIQDTAAIVAAIFPF